MSVKPRLVGARVLVKQLEAAEQTTGGVVMPSDVRKREARGVVMEHGQWIDTLTGDVIGHFPVAVGDVVVWDARQPQVTVVLDVAENGHQEEFVVLNIGDVLLVLDEVTSAVRPT